MRVELPLEKGRDTHPSELQQPFVLPDFSSKTILLAEDNEINQLVVTGILEQTGVEFVVASTGREAVQKYNDGIDLVLMDVQMPEIDGFEATRIIKQTNNGAVVIALTANIMSDNIKQYEKSGFDAWLGKPIEKMLLLQTLNHYLKR